MATDTIDLALAVFREPSRLAEVRDRPLPEDIARIIRLAAGETAALHEAIQSSGATAESLAESCTFFLHQVLFAPGADAYRVLGARSDAPQARLRENYRWLMKLLHPDRHQDGWEAGYADRVNVAWQDLKTLDRRTKYDHRLHLRPSPFSSPAHIMSIARNALVETSSGPLLSGAMVRRLPALILGAMALSATAVVGLMYWAQVQLQQELANRRGGRDVSAALDSSGAIDLGLHKGTIARISRMQELSVVARSSEVLPVDMSIAPHTLAKPTAVKIALRFPVAPASLNVLAQVARLPAVSIRLDAGAAQTFSPAVAVPQAGADSLTTALTAAKIDPPFASIEQALISNDDARALLKEFAAAYASGDLARFDRLFQTAKGDPRAIDLMRKRFVTTDMRYIELLQLELEMGAESGRASARYRDTYVPRGGRRAVTEAGMIEWVLWNDAGAVRIASFGRDSARP